MATTKMMFVIFKVELEDSTGRQRNLSVVSGVIENGETITKVINEEGVSLKNTCTLYRSAVASVATDMSLMHVEAAD